MTTLKSTMLLAVTLFGISAPAPDAELLSEITSNLLIDTDDSPLEASVAAEPALVNSAPDVSGNAKMPNTGNTVSVRTGNGSKSQGKGDSVRS